MLSRSRAGLNILLALSAGIVGGWGAPPVAESPPAPAPKAAATPDEGCGVMGAAVSEDDAFRAFEACAVARERFAELMGHPVPEVRVVVESRRGYRAGTAAGRAVILWPSSASMAARARASGGADQAAGHVAAQWREVLPHEIVHALLATRFYPDGDLPEEGYGTPLPDWLEEGAAIWAEPARSRRSRLATARELPRVQRDLRAILEGEHPAAANRDALAVRDGAAPPSDQALWDFYPQSIAVVEFIYDQGGRPAFRELARRLADDPEDPEALVGLPGLPARMDRLVARWERWLGSEPDRGAVPE